MDHTMMLRTNNLTQRWVNGLGGGVSVGPLTGPAAFPAHVSHANYNLKGSVQVNVGIDLREYHSMMKWYTTSNYTRSRNEADPAAQAVPPEQGRHARGGQPRRTIITGLSAGLTPLQRAQMGNLRGLRGWITHMALYLKRGTIAGGLGGTAKNLAPALLKSPPAVAAQYGMTPNEQAYFTLNRRPIVNQILVAVGSAGRADGRAAEQRGYLPDRSRRRGHRRPPDDARQRLRAAGGNADPHTDGRRIGARRQCDGRGRFRRLR